MTHPSPLEIGAALAAGREEEGAFEEAIHALGARMERLQQDSGDLRRKMRHITEEEQVGIGREPHAGIGHQRLVANAMESCRNLAREHGSEQAHHGNLQATLAQLCQQDASEAWRTSFAALWAQGRGG